MSRLSGADPLSSTNAEGTILGALLRDVGFVDDVIDRLRPEDFSIPGHGLIWQAIDQLYHHAKRSRQPTVISVAEQLGQMGVLGQTGGLEYLATLARDAPGELGLSTHVSIVLDYARRRRIRDAGEAIARESYSRSDPDDLGTHAYGCLDQAVDGGQDEPGCSITDLIPKMIDEIDWRQQNPGALLGLSTGLTDLDNLLSGLCPGALYVLGARPSLGKTALAIQIALGRILLDHPVFIASLEMPAKALGYRMAAQQAGIPTHDIRTGNVRDADWALVADAFRDIGTRPLWIDDTPSLHIRDLPARVRRFQRRQGGRLGLVIVDYLQLMIGEGENRTQRIGSISRALKGLAKTHDVPVLALAQISRDIDQRTDKRPLLSDLRESGDIEADSDTVMFLHREGFYDDQHPYPDITQILVRKNREGPRGEVNLLFDGPINRFKPMHGALPHDYYTNVGRGRANRGSFTP